MSFALCRPTRPIGIGRTGNEAKSRARRETDPALRGNAQILIFYILKILFHGHSHKNFWTNTPSRKKNAAAAAAAATKRILMASAGLSIAAMTSSMDW